MLRIRIQFVSMFLSALIAIASLQWSPPLQAQSVVEPVILTAKKPGGGSWLDAISDFFQWLADIATLSLQSLLEQLIGDIKDYTSPILEDYKAPCKNDNESDEAWTARAIAECHEYAQTYIYTRGSAVLQMLSGIGALSIQSLCHAEVAWQSRNNPPKCTDLH